MKRLILFFLCCVALVACLCSCAQQISGLPVPDTTRQPNPIAQDATSPFIRQILASMPKSDVASLEDAILAETDEYMYYRSGGRCYLSFKSGDKKESYTEEEIKEGSMIHTVHFETLDEMHQWLEKPELTQEDASVIRHTFPLIEGKGFLMLDREMLYVPELPEGYHFESAEFMGERYNIVFKTDEKLTSGRYGGGMISFIEEEEFARKLAYFYRYQRGHAAYDVSYTIEENNATVYEFHKDVGIRRHVQYCLETENGVLFIEELRYDSGSETNKLVAMGMEILGCQNGVYFTLGVHYTDPEQLLEFAKQMKLVPYLGQ